jgi:hypothetical protein
MKRLLHPATRQIDNANAALTTSMKIPLAPDSRHGAITCEEELAAIREDLVALERLLANLDTLPVEIREERRRECLELVAELAAEIRQRIADTKVIPITAAKRREVR